MVRRLNALEQSNPDAADFNGKVRDVLELVESLRATMPSAVRALFDQWRAEASAYAAARRPGRRAPAPSEVRRESSALGDHARGDALPTVRFGCWRAACSTCRQNSDGSIGLRLNLRTPGRRYPMAELSIPQTGAGLKPRRLRLRGPRPARLARRRDLRAELPGPRPAATARHLTTLHGSTPPGQTLVLNLHCTEQAGASRAGPRWCGCTCAASRPAAFEVSDGVSKPTITRGDARDEIEALRRENGPSAPRRRRRPASARQPPRAAAGFGGAARREGPRTRPLRHRGRAPPTPGTSRGGLGRPRSPDPGGPDPRAADRGAPRRGHEMPIADVQIHLRSASCPSRTWRPTSPSSAPSKADAASDPANQATGTPRPPRSAPPRSSAPRPS